MRARIAAAVVFVGSLSALLLILGQSGTSSLFAAVQEKLKEVRSVTFDVSSRRGDEPAQVGHFKLLGEDLGRVENPSGEYTIFDRKQRKMMEVNPNERKAVIRTNVEGENPIPNFFGMLLGASERSVKELGHREFDGKKLAGFVAEMDGRKCDVWVDPSTKLPVRIEERHKLEGTKIETVMSKFAYNAKLDPAQFRIEPPEGYTVEQRELYSIEENARHAREQERRARERAMEAARKKKEMEDR